MGSKKASRKRLRPRPAVAPERSSPSKASKTSKASKAPNEAPTTQQAAAAGATPSRSDDERLDAVFHCLSDPTRRKIIGLLREAGELKVTDIAEVFSMSLNAVSKHLKVLERAELVHREVRGREHWLRVNWAALQGPYEWLHFYHHFWASRLDALVDYVKKGKKP